MKENALYVLSLSLLFCFSLKQSVAQEDATGVKELQIVESKLVKDVRERMPIDVDTTFAKNSKVFLWMKLTGGASDQITVTWNNGATTHVTTLMIGGSPWRTWASKTVRNAGEWTVTVADASGKVLKELRFRVE